MSSWISTPSSQPHSWRYIIIRGPNNLVSKWDTLENGCQRTCVTKADVDRVLCHCRHNRAGMGEAEQPRVLGANTMMNKAWWQLWRVPAMERRRRSAFGHWQCGMDWVRNRLSLLEPALQGLCMYNSYHSWKAQHGQGCVWVHMLDVPVPLLHGVTVSPVRVCGKSGFAKAPAFCSLSGYSVLLQWCWFL